ncbi:Spy/CpxP family protein refolding chaperone [Methylocella sp.]|uniref:Spy/CpxP family protein refolding chaperone n=1 Tax=Methylocella sp. TaxID=1978226 RepID=UPI0037841C03
MRPVLATAALLAGGLSLAAFNATAQPASPPPPPAGAPAPGGPGPGPRAHGDRDRPERPRFSAADREAFFDAHLAGLHAGLKLSPEQEKLWPPVEAAIRAAAKSAAERFEKLRAERPADMIAWLRRASDDAAARSQSLKSVADAAAPLYQSLTEEQKARLPHLLRGPWARGLGFFPPHHMMMGPMKKGPEGGAPEHEDDDDD